MRDLDQYDPRARPARVIMILRHAALTRLTHWLNAVCFCVLAASGMQIFNAWPALYWGQTGADGDRAVLAIGAMHDSGRLAGHLRVGPWTLPATGVLGVSTLHGEPVQRAFPAWLTLPAGQDLATGRRWHLFFAWSLVFNGALYLVHSVVSGHLRRDLLPRRRELAPGRLWHEIVDHVRLRFPKGEAARRYNALQQLSYLAVIGVLLPLMVLTGLSMSPAMDAAFPWLPDLFGGRQSARTLHFTAAALLVLFVVVHLAMVVLSGAWNNLRSMLSGRYAIQEGDVHE